MYKTKAPLVLASASPRRRDFLSRMGLDYQLLPSGLDEDLDLGLAPERLAAEWARRKALDSARAHGPDQWYLGVDTIVVVDGEVLGKPDSRSQAREFLGRLSGRWHVVVSGYCIVRPGSDQRIERTASSRVKIKELEADEIAAYVDTGEPMDKAGGYAVQGIGAFMVEAIDGSYTNVVGMPLTEVINDLVALGVIEVDGEGRKWEQ